MITWEKRPLSCVCQHQRSDHDQTIRGALHTFCLFPGCNCQMYLPSSPWPGVPKPELNKTPGSTTPHTVEIDIQIRRPGKQTVTICAPLSLDYALLPPGQDFDPVADTAAALARQAWDKQEVEG